MDLAARGLRVIVSTWTVRASGAGTVQPDADLVRFISASRCQLEPRTQTPSDDVLLNLFGMSVNHVLTSMGLAPVNGPGFAPRPGNLQGLIALSFSSESLVNSLVSNSIAHQGASFCPSLISNGLCLLDARQDAAAVTLRRLPGEGFFRAFLQVAEAPVDICDFAGINGTVTVYSGDFMLVARDGAAGEAGLPIDEDSHATIQPVPAVDGVIGIANGEGMTIIHPGVPVTFRGGSLQCVQAFEGYVDVRVNVLTLSSMVNNANVTSRILLFEDGWTSMLIGLAMPPSLAAMVNLLLRRLNLRDFFEQSRFKYN